MPAGTRRALVRIPIYNRTDPHRGSGWWSGPILKEKPMLYTIAIVLLVLWLLGFSVFHVAGSLIHLILVIAVILFVLGLFRGRSL